MDLPFKPLFKSNGSAGAGVSPSAVAGADLIVSGKLGARTPGLSCGVFLDM